MADAAAGVDPLCVVQMSQAYATTVMGPYFAGWQANLLLFGFTCSAYISYIGSELYKRDRTWVKATVWVTLFFATVVAICNYVEMLDWSLKPDRTEEGLNEVKWLDAFTPIISGFVALPVQVYLGRRSILCISNRRLQLVFGVILSFFIFATLATCWAFGAASFLWRTDALDKLYPWTFNVALQCWLWCEAICDVLIAVSLWLSLKRKVENFNEETDYILRRLGRQSLQTGLTTALLAAVGAITCSTFPGYSTYNTVPTAFWLVLPSLYALSLIVNLSSRAPPRKSSNKDGVSGFRPGQTAYAIRSNASLRVSVAVVQERRESINQEMSWTLPKAPTSVLRARGRSSFGNLDEEVQRFSIPFPPPDKQKEEERLDDTVSSGSRSSTGEDEEKQLPQMSNWLASSQLKQQ